MKEYLKVIKVGKDYIFICKRDFLQIKRILKENVDFIVYVHNYIIILVIIYFFIDLVYRLILVIIYNIN